MATSKKKIEKRTPAKKTPKPVEKTGCDQLPGKNAKEDTNRPPCPEGYQDRQPTTPPVEDPQQRPH